MPGEDSGFDLNYFQGCILTMEILRWFLFCFNRVHSDNQTREALPHSGSIAMFWNLFEACELVASCQGQGSPEGSWARMKIKSRSGNDQNFSCYMHYQVGKPKWFISSFSRQRVIGVWCYEIQPPASVPSHGIFSDSFISLSLFFLHREYNSLRSTALSLCSRRS